MIFCQQAILLTCNIFISTCSLILLILNIIKSWLTYLSGVCSHNYVAYWHNYIACWYNLSCIKGHKYVIIWIKSLQIIVQLYSGGFFFKHLKQCTQQICQSYLSLSTSWSWYWNKTRNRPLCSSVSCIVGAHRCTV